MAQSTTQDDNSVEVLLEFLGVIGVVFFALFFYSRKEKISRLFRSCMSLFKAKARSDGSRDTENDLEKAPAAEGQPSSEQPRGKHSSLHARVLAYLYSLPRESHEFIHTREVETGSSGDHSDGNVTEDYEGTDESLESNWIEIIYDFPVPPPDTGAHKAVTESTEIQVSGTSGVSREPAICAAGDETDPEPRPSNTSADGHCLLEPK